MGYMDCITIMLNVECYVCKELGGDLVRPCINENCAGRVHSQCLETQIINNDELCGCCRQPIIVKSKIKYDECCKYFTKMTYLLIMFIGGTTLTVLNAEGRSLGGNIVCPESRCLDALTITITSVFSLIFWQGHLFQLLAIGLPKCNWNIFCCKSIKNKIKYKSYITIFIMFLFTNLLVTLAHFMGQFIIKYKYDEYSFYNARTSLWGYVVYAIILAICAGIALIGGIIYGMVLCIRNNFSTNEYGTRVMDETIYSI